MEGRILGFDREGGRGTLRGDNGKDYEFVSTEYRGENEPQANLRVCFEVVEEAAIAVVPLDNSSSQARQFVAEVGGAVVDFARVEKLEAFNFKEMFSEVFRKHSDRDVENYLIVGTETTTPTLEEVDTAWPKPWLFFRAFLGALLVFVIFVQAWNEFQNPNLIPGLILVGSFVVPLATLILFFELNVRKNVSLYQVLKLVFFGGILSIFFSLFLFQFVNVLNLSWLGASVAGLVEEPGKLLALALVPHKRRYNYILNGLLFGAAIGTGFAAFESAGYALRVGIAANDASAMINIIILRGLLSPFSHIAWTGMCAAALWRVKEEQQFRWDMLKDERFWRIFAIAVVLHMIWNSPIEIALFGKYVILGFIAWLIILSLVQAGLKQIRAEKLARQPMITDSRDESSTPPE